MTEQPTLDDVLQAAANIKEEITELFNELAALAVLCDDDSNGTSRLASTLRCSTNFVNTLASGYVTLGPEYLNAETDPVLWKLDDWLRAILKADDPRHWLEQARLRGLNAAQIRNEAGVKQERTPAWYDGSGTYEPDKIAILLDMEPQDNTRRRVALKAR